MAENAPARQLIPSLPTWPEPQRGRPSRPLVRLLPLGAGPNRLARWWNSALND